jgi:hypothetical protein
MISPAVQIAGTLQTVTCSGKTGIGHKKMRAPVKRPHFLRRPAAADAASHVALERCQSLVLQIARQSGKGEARRR